MTAQTSPPQAENPTALVRAEPGGKNTLSAPEFPATLQPSDSFRVSTVVWHSLVMLFQRQAIAAWRNGGNYGAESYKEAQYVMVALADEIFLNTKWEGQRAWGSNLLETKIFRTHAAGQFFFDKLDRLLREQNPINRDLAAVYLMALSLGFKGKYDGMDHRRTLANYRRQLLTFICGREPGLDDETRYVFPEAYYHNVREERQRKLSDPRKWFVVLGLVIVGYTAATQAFWMQFTQELYTVNQSITNIIGKLKAQP
jgi:type VI secretion system protein ImpK